MNPVPDTLNKLFREAEESACELYKKDITTRSGNDADHYTIKGKDINIVKNERYLIWAQDPAQDIRGERIREATKLYQKGIPFRTAALIALAVSVIASAILLAAGPFLGAVVFTAVVIVSIAAGVTFLISLITLVYHSHILKRDYIGLMGIQHVLRAQKYIDDYMPRDERIPEDVLLRRQNVFKTIVAEQFKEHDFESVQKGIERALKEQERKELES